MSKPPDIPISRATAAGLIAMVEEMAAFLGIKTGDELARQCSSHAWAGIVGLNAIHRALKSKDPALSELADFLNHCYWRYRRVSEREYSLAMSDREVKRWMAGSAMWDDPPDGWGEAELLLYSRGYLNAESTQLGNAAEYFRAALYKIGYFPSEKPKGKPVKAKSRGKVVAKIKAVPKGKPKGDKA